MSKEDLDKLERKQKSELDPTMDKLELIYEN